MIRPAIFLLSTFVLAPAAAGQDAGFAIPEARLEQIETGDPYIQVWRDESRDDGAIDVFGVVDIAATPEVIWNVMTDCERSEAIVDEMKSCEVVKQADDGSWDIREQKTKVNFLITFTSRFRSDYVPYKSIAISRAGGDMKVQSGMWALNAIGSGKTRLTYRAASAPSFPVSKSKMMSSFQDSLPKILSNLRAEAESDFSRLK